MPRDTQPTFTGGEITPSLHARVDLERYYSSLAKCYNFFVRSHGGVSNRAGLEFVYRLAAPSPEIRLFPFAFNVEQTYALVFGNLEMRVIKDGAIILNDVAAITGVTLGASTTFACAGHTITIGEEVFVSGLVGPTALNGRSMTVTGISAGVSVTVSVNSTGYPAWTAGGSIGSVFVLVTPYPASKLSLLKYTQSADIMTIAHPDYPLYDISRTGHNLWSIDQVTFLSSATAPTGITLGQVGTLPGVTKKKQYRYVVTSVDNTGAESVQSDTVETEALSASRTMDNINNGNPALVTDPSHGYTTNDEILITDCTTFTELNGGRYTITTAGGNAYFLNGVDMSSHVFPNDNETNGNSRKVTGEIQLLDSGWGNLLSWSDVVGAVYYNVYKEQSASNIFGFIGEAESDGGGSTSFTDYNLGPDMSFTPPIGNDPFSTSDNYPSCVAYHQQRMAFASPNNNLQRFWLSRSADFDNMNYSRPSRASDSIETELAAEEVNQIRHIMSLDELILFTSGAEWLIQADADGVLTPGNPNPTRQGKRGCSHVKPLVVGDDALYIQEKGSRVRTLGYQFESDKYLSDDLSLLAEHMFQGRTIVDWAYSQEPHSLVWVVLDNGLFLSLTYIQEQKVWGWARHETNGRVISVISISEGDEDAVYFSVIRTIEGEERQFVERMHTRIVATVDESFHVDSGLTYVGRTATISNIVMTSLKVTVTATAHAMVNDDVVWLFGMEGADELTTRRFVVKNSTANTFEIYDFDNDAVTGIGVTPYIRGGTVQYCTPTISNLYHLEDAAVTVLADGNVDGPFTVVGGMISLSQAAHRVNVGLSYFSEMQTLDVDFKGQAPLTGLKKAISSVSLQVQNTRGVSAGDPERPSSLREYKERTPESGYRQLPVTTATQWIPVSIPWSSGGNILVRQTYPLPATILSITPEVSSNED